MIFALNTVLVAFAAFIGALVGVIVKKKGPKAAAILFGVVTLFYLVSPRVVCRPDPDDAMLHITRKSFAAEEEITCRWRVYDTSGPVNLSAWCNLDEHGKWQPYIIPLAN